MAPTSKLAAAKNVLAVDLAKLRVAKSAGERNDAAQADRHLWFIARKTFEGRAGIEFR